MVEFAYTYTPNTTKVKSTDRIIVLERAEGKNVKNTSGMTDNRLFTGDNKLHAKLDPHNMLWYLQMDSGILADPLRQKFTTFNKLKDYITAYFAKRNIIVKEVID
jgi:hypothetical protein